MSNEGPGPRQRRAVQEVRNIKIKGSIYGILALASLSAIIGPNLFPQFVPEAIADHPLLGIGMIAVAVVGLIALFATSVELGIRLPWAEDNLQKIRRYRHLDTNESPLANRSQHNEGLKRHRLRVTPLRRRRGVENKELRDKIRAQQQIKRTNK
jgi:hypothetical protein